MPYSTHALDESDRQLIVLALAELSLTRPGWHYALGLVAQKFSAKEMFEQFRVTSSCPTCHQKLPPRWPLPTVGLPLPGPQDPKRPS